MQASNRFLFGLAHASRSLGWSHVDLLLAWHLHIDAGLTGVQTGWLLFAFLVLGGSATFLVGLMFTRYQVAGNMVVRIQLPAAVATALLLWIQFSVDSVAAVICAGLAFRIAYAVQDVSQNMLASLLPADEEDARHYARLRVVLSAIARCLVVCGFAFPVPADNRSLLAPIGLVMIMSAISLEKLVFPVRSRASPIFGARGYIPQGLPLLLVAWAAFAMLLPTLNRLLIFTPAIEGLSKSGAWLLVGYCLGSVIGPLLRCRIELSILLALVVASGALMILPLPLPSPAILRVAGAVVHGFAVSGIGVQLWAATSRIAMDDGRRGRSSDGMVFGSVIVTIHLMSAAGMLAVGPLIEGFESGRLAATLCALMLTATGAIMIQGMGISGKRVFSAA